MKISVLRIKNWTGFPALLLFIIFYLINIAVTDSFSFDSLRSFLITNCPSICLAVGVATTILIGGTDISLGSIVTLTNVVTVTLVESGYSVLTASLLALVSACFCGVLNGAIISFLRINPLLTTFATSTVFSGIALWLLPYPGGAIPFEFNEWFTRDIFWIFPMMFIVVLVPMIIWFIVYKSPARIHVYSIGNSMQKAYVSGIPVTTIRFFVHVFAGFTAGIAGLCISASLSAGNPTVGATMSLTSIAAAVIGGVSLTGGKGGIIGAIFGSLFLSILISIVVSANMSSFVQGFVQSVILLLGVVFSVVAGHERHKTLPLKKEAAIG